MNTGKVYFTAGEYGDLSLTHSKKVSTVKNGSGEVMDVNKLEGVGVYYHYYREIKNLELIGVGDVEIKGSILSESGQIYGTESAPKFDPIREIESTGTSYSYYGHIAVEGLSFKNLIIDGGIIRFEQQNENSSVKNVLIDNCMFIGESSTSDFDQAISFKTNGKSLFENIAVVDCVVKKHKIGFYGQSINGVRIEGCSFDSIGKNAMQIQNVGAFKFGGVVSIKNNTISNTADRAIRFGEGDGATIAIENNIFTESVDSNGELLKTQSLTNCTYSFTDNTYNGEPIANVEEGSDSSWIVTIPTKEV